jgi:hypothetical protein
MMREILTWNGIFQIGISAQTKVKFLANMECVRYSSGPLIPQLIVCRCQFLLQSIGKIIGLNITCDKIKTRLFF